LPVGALGNAHPFGTVILARVADQTTPDVPALQSPLEDLRHSHLDKPFLLWCENNDLVSTAILASGGKPRTWRGQVKRSGLPPLGEWLRLYRLLVTGLWIERHPDAALWDVGKACGWPHGPALRQRCYEVLGVRPTAFRSWLDVEPALCCWLTRRRNRYNLTGDAD